MIRTGYSFKTAYGHLADVASRLKEIGWNHAPICDRMSTFGFNKWTKLVKKEGMKPIYGVELAVVTSLGDKKPTIDYWKFLAKDTLKPLHELIGQATSNVGREPSVLYKEALAAKGLIKITGERLQLDQLDRANARDLYFGLSPSTPKGLAKQALAAGMKPVAISDNFYPRASDIETYRVGLGFRSGTQTYPMHILSDEEWCDATAWTIDTKTQEKAIKQRQIIFEECNATLTKASLLSPQKDKSLYQLCVEGADRLKVKLDDPVYRDRLAKELQLIQEKQFEDYFYIIADMMAYAKQNMVVGPARGSSCGSLVCYLLGITAIDPIPFDLIFERFIDTTRSDLPDIDLDFSDTRRQMVFDYVEEKYGSERVARLGTVGLFKPRSALNAAGAALKVPKWQVGKVTDSIIERSSGDSRALQVLEDTLNDTEAGRKLKEDFPEIMIAAGLEGHPNNASQHAAGIVVTQNPIDEYVAIDRRTKSAMCDKKDAEDLNLLKIDALGLTQLSIFERTLELIGEPDVAGFLEKLPIDDQKAFNVLNRGHFSGVFQFMGGALQSLTKQVKITELADMVAITALARPGPMATGGANSWVKRKSGLEKVTYPDPMLEPYLKETLGIVVYQEQVMQIGREVGDLTWEDVTALRKAMSKSLGEEFFDQYGDRWKAAAIKKGMPTDVANKFWKDLCAFGSWGFNKSHAVAYGLVSYWCCWLKAHHPVEFAAATLDAESDPTRQIALLRELQEEGISYKPFDPEHSTNKWEPVRNGNETYLVGPLTVIDGIGSASVQEIIDARARGKPIRASIAKKLANAKTKIDTLYPVRDAIKSLYPDGLQTINIVSSPSRIKDVQCGINGEVLILAVASKIAPKDENEAVNVAKRGYKLNGPTQALNLFMKDDSDEIFCKVNRYKFERLGRPILENGRVGRSLYAVKGTVPKDFRMISITNIRYLGEIDELDFAESTSRGEAQ